MPPQPSDKNIMKTQFPEPGTITLDQYSVAPFPERPIDQDAVFRTDITSRLGDDWKIKAACKGPQRVYFYPPEYREFKEEKQEREQTAIDICGFCAVRTECLDCAISNKERYGIWGGMTEEDRKQAILLGDNPRR